jgi:hypothetical protein
MCERIVFLLGTETAHNLNPLQLEPSDDIKHGKSTAADASQNGSARGRDRQSDARRRDYRSGQQRELCERGDPGTQDVRRGPSDARRNSGRLIQSSLEWIDRAARLRPTADPQQGH